MTRSVSNTVRMSLRSMGKQLLYLMGTVTHQAPKTVFMSRSRGKIGVTVQFTSSMIDFTLKKKKFLSNEQNKQRFIILLSQRLEQSGCEIHQATGDADVLIVHTALKSATEQETVLVGDDTDLLVFLIYHAKNVSHTVYFRPETKRSSQNGNTCWNIPAIRALLGSMVTNNILFLHAILGCDTTSGIYGLSKKLSILLTKSNRQFQDQARSQ